ncbi:MAG: threonine/serine exporter family protein [Desulfobacteraceae bacterium]|jgi:uncharacterized membrane protein YjjB (DUF3815 family)
MYWLDIIVKSVYGGIAAVGFGVLFNVPERTIFYTFIFGALGIFMKFTLLEVGIGMISATLISANVIGTLSLLASYDKCTPARVFSIPAVIPMVPGIYIYRMMLGLMQLHGEPRADFNSIVTDMLINGVNAGFIIMALSVGVGIPNLIFRKDMFNELKTSRRPKR